MLRAQDQLPVNCQHLIRSLTDLAQKTTLVTHTQPQIQLQKNDTGHTYTTTDLAIKKIDWSHIHIHNHISQPQIQLKNKTCYIHNH